MRFARSTIWGLYICLLFTVNAQGATYYVDNTLAADCDGAATHYDPATCACVAGAGAKGYNQIYEAVNATSAGDTVLIMYGTGSIALAATIEYLRRQIPLLFRDTTLSTYQPLMRPPACTIVSTLEGQIGLYSI